MTITATSLATNTVQVTASGTNNTFASLIDAVRDAVIGVAPVATTGWTLHDDVTVALLRTQVFKAQNKDGISFKYLIARWDLGREELNTTTCESWNATTHVATNEAHTFFDCSPVGFATQNCDMIVMVSPRWLAFTSFINNEQGLWSGVFEMGREDPNDTAAAGYPCWAWMSATLPMLGQQTVSTSAKGLNGNDYTLCSMPRTRDGSTGVNAAKRFAADYGTVSFPNWLITAAQSFMFSLGNQVNKFIANQWNITGKLTLPIKPIHNYDQTYATNYGTMFGLKVTGNSGSSSMNKIALKVDSDGNYSNEGTTNNHWLLNTAYKPITYIDSAWFGNTAWSALSLTIGVSQQPIDIVSTGLSYYMTTASGKLYKVDTLTLTVTEITAAGTGCNRHLAYDGERYLYVGSSAGLVRLDTVDDSCIILTCCAGGVLAIAISDTHILCTPYSSSPTPILVRLSRASAFDAANVTAGTLAALTTFAENVYLGTITVAPNGNFFVYPSYIGLATNAKLVMISAAGAVTYPQTSSTVVYNDASLQILTSTIGLLWRASTTASGTYCTHFNLSNGVVINNDALATTSPYAASYSFGSPSFKLGGVNMFMPRYSGTAKHVNTKPCGDGVNASSITGAQTINTTNITETNSGNGTPICFDGTKIIMGTVTGIKIITGINNTYVQSGVTLGQFCIPS